MRKFLAFLQRIENFILTWSFIVMTLSAFAQVVNRNFIGAGIPWFEELARYCMIYMALLGTEFGLRDGSQIAVTFLIDHFKGVPRLLFDIFAKLIVVVFSVTVFCYSWAPILKQIRFGQLTSGLQIPMYIPYAALPLSFGIISVVQTVMLCTLIAKLFSRPGRETAEGGAA